MQELRRVVFAGTPEFAVPALDALIASGRAPVAVVTQPDRPAGRGRRLTVSPVKRRALDAGIPVLHALRGLAALEPDLVVVVAYGRLLPRAVLALPRAGCINVHASLLPRWRGASPIQHAILAGDAETGVSIMRMDEGLDTGAVFLERRTPVAADDTGSTLHDRLAVLGARALTDALDGIEQDTLSAVPQPEHGATYAPKLAKSDAWLDWSRPAVELERRVRAFDPWPVAQTRLGDTILRIWKTELPGDRSRACGSDAMRRDSRSPGTIIEASDKGILVATGTGTLLVTELQLPGGRRIAAREFAARRALAGMRVG